MKLKLKINLWIENTGAFDDSKDRIKFFNNNINLVQKITFNSSKYNNKN